MIPKTIKSTQRDGSKREFVDKLLPNAAFGSISISDLIILNEERKLSAIDSRRNCCLPSAKILKYTRFRSEQPYTERKTRMRRERERERDEIFRITKKK